MSAYVCHPATPDTLASVASPDLIARTVARLYPAWPPMTADTLGDYRGAVARYLASTNLRAVLYCYPDTTPDTVPGHVYACTLNSTIYRPMPSEAAHPYTPTALARAVNSHGGYGDLTAVNEVAAARRVIGVARAYSYQASELPEWAGSAAREFVEAVTLEVAAMLAQGWDLDAAEDTARAWERAGLEVDA